MTGFYLVLLGFIRLIMGFTGFYRVSLGVTGLFWVNTGFYWILLGFTGFYWVLLGFVGLDRVALIPLALWGHRNEWRKKNSTKPKTWKKENETQYAVSNNNNNNSNNNNNNNTPLYLLNKNMEKKMNGPFFGVFFFFLRLGCRRHPSRWSRSDQLSLHFFPFYRVFFTGFHGRNSADQSEAAFRWFPFWK